MFDSPGMKTYMMILQLARANKSLIGSKYYLHDRYFKLWCSGKTSEEIVKATMSLKEKKRMEKLDSKVNKKVKLGGTIKQSMTKEEIQIIIDKVNNKETKNNSRVIASVSTQTVPFKENKKMSERNLSNKEKDELLKEAWRKTKLKVLANSLKFEDRLSHIKSVGNGL